MQVVILTDIQLKNELLGTTSSLPQNIIWVEELSELQNHKDADAFVDLLFNKDHLTTLKALLPKLVVINSVIDTLSETNPSFVRINAWPTFLQSNLIEASSAYEARKQSTEELLSLFNKKIEWLPDEPGFVTPRIISMVINEAFISLNERVSTKQEIDTAMKLGTNYPYGPFEWAEKIGMNNIQALLQKLAEHQPRYTSFISAG
jgi:3-hydroxybutyryl-CoA dehydrogenase